MELTATGQRAMDGEQQLVHDWRVSRLTRLGIPAPLAEVYANRVDWHQIARLVQRGCPARLALRIASCAASSAARSRPGSDVPW